MRLQTRWLGAVAAVFVATACRDLTTLEQLNPAALSSATVYTPTNAQLFTNGAIADFECAFSRYVVGSGTLMDELSNSFASGSNYDYDARRNPTNAAYGTSSCTSTLQQAAIYTTLSVARRAADTAVARLKEFSDASMPAGVSRSKLIGQGYAYAGYSIILLGEGMCSAAGARMVRVARDDAERARLWQGRKKAFGAMGRISPHLVVQDAVIPRTRLPDVLAVIREIAERQRITVCNVFHAGDGNLHPNIGYDANDPDEQARVHAAMREIMATCVAAGGTITGEHGIGLDKLDYMNLIFSEESLAAMCRLREVFDPARRANPGKVVPVHSCREWHGAPRAAWTA